MEGGGYDAEPATVGLPPSQDFSPRSDLAVVSRALVETDAAAHRVFYFPPPDESFMVLDAAVPADPAGLEPSDFRTLCLGCLLDQHPEAGRGMDVARQAGSPRRVGSARWVPEVREWLEETEK